MVSNWRWLNDTKRFRYHSTTKIKPNQRSSDPEMSLPSTAAPAATRGRWRSCAAVAASAAPASASGARTAGLVAGQEKKHDGNLKKGVPFKNNRSFFVNYSCKLMNGSDKLRRIIRNHSSYPELGHFGVTPIQFPSSDVAVIFMGFALPTIHLVWRTPWAGRTLFFQCNGF